MPSLSGSGSGIRDHGYWRGRATGDYWALPPRDHPAFRELISAGDIRELDRAPGPGGGTA